MMEQELFDNYRYSIFLSIGFLFLLLTFIQKRRLTVQKSYLDRPSNQNKTAQKTAS